MLPRTLFSEYAADSERLLDLRDVRQAGVFERITCPGDASRGGALLQPPGGATFRPRQRLHPAQVEERELIDQAVLALPYTASKGHAAQNESGCFKLLQDRAQVATRQSTAFDELRPRETGSLGGERFDDLQMPLVMLEERRVELAELIAQSCVLHEEQSIDILRGRAAFADFVEVVRDAAHRHEDLQDLNGIERDAAALQELRGFAQVERLQGDRTGDAVVQAALVVQHVHDHPGCCRAADDEN